MWLLNSRFWLQGQVSVRVKGKESERLLNQCLARGIYLWDVKWEEGKLSFRMRSRDFFRLRPLVRQLKVKVTIKEKIGLPFFWRRFKRRRTLAWGGVLFLLMLYTWSSCIWSVRIEGANHPERQKQLGQLLAGQGVMQGVLKQRVDLRAIEHEVLTQFPELAWARAYFTGTRFVLEVVPKLSQPQLQRPGHLVATKNGLIYDMLVLAGRPLVEKGSSVSAGDVLILGEQGRRPVPAKGRVLARVWHEAYLEGDAVERHLVRSGNSVTKKVLRLINWPVYIGGVKKVPFEYYETERERKSVVPWRNSISSVEVIEEIYYELKEIKKVIPESECAQRLLKQAAALAKQELAEGSKIIQTDKKILSQPGDIPIRVWVRIEAVEDIARPIPYYPRTGEGGIGIGGTIGEEDSSS